MPFHIRLTTKSNPTDDEIKLDLSIEQLKERFLNPYNEGKFIVINGKSVSIEDIERIRINETEKYSEELLPKIKSERARSSVIVTISDEWYVTKEGKDVTDDFITNPPGHIIENQDKRSKNNKTSIGLITENRIFIQNRELKAMLFQASNNNTTKVTINSKVDEVGLDIRFMLTTKSEYQKLFQYWLKHPANPKNPQGVYSSYPEQPKINTIFEQRTNIIEKEFAIKTNETYAWIFDNTYSKLQGKTIYTKISLQSEDKIETKSSLPLIDLFNDKLPIEILSDLKAADECFRCNHYRQSAIMFRTALESAIKIKILQSNLPLKIIQDTTGNEKRLSDKLSILVSNGLISNTIKSDIEFTVKWFGDSGVHTNMPIVEDDIRLNIEPRFRKFLNYLNLKN